MAERFEDILSECIDRVLQGESVEQCLARYPEQAGELEPLLRTAVAAREASAVESRPEFKAQVRYQIHSRLSAGGRKTAQKGMPVLGWVPRWAVVVAVMFLVILLAGSSTVAASSTSMPDDTLYPVKLATENVRLRLNRTNMGKARLHVALVDRRIQEIAYLARKGDAERVERIASRLAAHLDAVRRLIELEAGKPGRQQAISDLKELLEERVRSNEALLLQLGEGNGSSSGMVNRILERYRQGWQRVLGLAGGSNG
ncbi:MAG: hypothetical protein A2Y72_00685 [Chloroflexi bacterium RBG_13_53_26]|nr:MAG: hypothetical protein A2Y72_00685 [Chloroflexi bacterium RBG_13_53_26]